MHLPLDELRHVLDDVAGELRLEPALVEQVEDAADAQRVVEERHAPPLAGMEDVVDRRQPVLELAAHVLTEHGGQPLDVGGGQHVVGQHLEIGVHQREVAVAQPARDADWIEQLQPNPLARVQGGGDVAFERREGLRGRRRGRRASAGGLGPERRPRRHREDLGLDAEQSRRAAADELPHVVAVGGRLQDARSRRAARSPR